MSSEVEVPKLFTNYIVEPSKQATREYSWSELDDTFPPGDGSLVAQLAAIVRSDRAELAAAHKEIERLQNLSTACYDALRCEESVSPHPRCDGRNDKLVYGKCDACAAIKLYEDWIAKSAVVMADAMLKIGDKP